MKMFLVFVDELFLSFRALLADMLLGRVF